MRLERNVVFWIIILAVVVGLLVLLHHILLPFVVGAALAYVLNPLANRLTKRGMSRLVAALVILCGFILVFGVVFVVAAPILARQIAGLIANVPAYAQRLQEIANDPSHTWLNYVVGGRSSAGGNPVGTFVSKFIDYLTGVLPSLLTEGEALLSLFSLLVIAPVVAFYMLCDWSAIIGAFDDLIPLHQRDTVRGLARDINTAISGYFHGQLIVCLILACYYAAGLTLAGLSFGLLIGVVGGILSFIPYVGSLTVLVVSFGVAVAEFFPDWKRILIIVGVVLVGQFCEGNVLSPKLVGESVGLHPVWLIFALLAAGYLFGFVGLVLAVPLAAAAGVLTRFALRRYRESPYYTGGGPA